MKEDWYPIVAPKTSETGKERQKGRELRKSLWWKKLVKKGICHYCGKKEEALQMDHIVPIARGGKSKKSNLIPSCPSCNSEKKLHTPADMILKKLREERKK